jgi:23S rRNA (adenine2503-C2)-methyltransferase
VSESLPDGSPVDLRDLTLPELEALVADLGFPRYRAVQVFHWLHGRVVNDVSEMKNVPAALREALAPHAARAPLALVDVRASDDGSAKYAFRTWDGHVVESVLMPEEQKISVCLSTQAGCGLGCAFCATAALGLRRSLRPGEVTGQLHAIRRHLAATGDTRRVSNLVYMGMGEPLVNLKGTLGSLELLLHAQGSDFSSRRITVSTAGVVPGLERLGQSPHRVNLAVSLNATTQEVRARLMPIARQYPLDVLLAALRAFPLEPRRRITFEYVLLQGVNDTDADAKRLPRLVAGIPAKLNVIPWNPIAGCGFAAPDEAQVERFCEPARRAGYTVITRRSRGADIAAACGQLAGTLDP